MTNLMLVNLNPRWVGAGGQYVTKMVNGRKAPVQSREGVGVSFDCPCGSGECGRCMIDFTNPIDGGAPHRADGHTWKRTGSTFESMSLHPSIQRLDNCKWHGFLTAGVLIQC